MALTDRASLLREFYRILGITGSDRAAFVQDDTTLEGLYDLLQRGTWDAQSFLIDAGEAALWLTTATLTSTWLGTDAANGGRYTALPDDFLKLAGDAERSALHYPNGTRWGSLIEYRDKMVAGPDRYWFQGSGSGDSADNLWITRGSSPPSTLQISYHEKHATLADSTTVDFPEIHRPLIPAFAAERSLYQAWFPLDETGKAAVMLNLKTLKRKARSQGRQSKQPRKIRRPATLGRFWR